MIVVADTSPFVVLLTIEHIHVLPALFDQLVIPPEVAAELASPKRPQVVQSFIAAPPDWLLTRAPSMVEQIPGLDAGEAAAISLATELRADRIIIDEATGRRAAADRQLKVIGTIGVLVAAAERRLISLERAFEKVKQTDFWVSREFLDEQLATFRACTLTPEETEEPNQDRARGA